ncbi:hypothetical protein C8R43DRAFT_957909 [Mycena crocata]|nr:hypothetical protein C8R43DRAFT_957909 [Mycena crocata]
MSVASISEIRKSYHKKRLWRNSYKEVIVEGRPLTKQHNQVLRTVKDETVLNEAMELPDARNASNYATQLYVSISEQVDGAPRSHKCFSTGVIRVEQSQRRTRIMASQHLTLPPKECLPDSEAPITAVLLVKHDAAKTPKTPLKPDASPARGQTMNTAEAATYEAGSKHNSYPVAFIWVRVECVGNKHHGSARREIKKGGLRRPDLKKRKPHEL